MAVERGDVLELAVAQITLDWLQFRLGQIYVGRRRRRPVARNRRRTTAITCTPASSIDCTRYRSCSGQRVLSRRWRRRGRRNGRPRCDSDSQLGAA